MRPQERGAAGTWQAGRSESRRRSALKELPVGQVRHFDRDPVPATIGVPRHRVGEISQGRQKVLKPDRRAPFTPRFRKRGPPPKKRAGRCRPPHLQAPTGGWSNRVCLSGWGVRTGWKRPNRRSSPAAGELWCQRGADHLNRIWNRRSSGTPCSRPSAPRPWCCTCRIERRFRENALPRRRRPPPC